MVLAPLSNSPPHSLRTLSLAPCQPLCPFFYFFSSLYSKPFPSTELSYRPVTFWNVLLGHHPILYPPHSWPNVQTGSDSSFSLNWDHLLILAFLNLLPWNTPLFQTTLVVSLWRFTLFHLDFGLWLREENIKDTMPALLIAERNTIPSFLKHSSTQWEGRGDLMSQLQ